MKAFLSAQEVFVLKEAHRAARTKRPAYRINTILLLNQGYTYKQIAKILLLDTGTLREYYRQYRKEGVDGLLEDHYQGKQSSLTLEQEKALDIHLQEYTYLTAKEIRNYIKKTFGVKYSLEGTTKLLHRLGFTYKKTKRVPSKADSQAQEEFISQYEKIKESKDPEDRIYFLDAVHPIHNSMASYGWIKKGTIKELTANTGRQRLNLNGALSLEDMQVTVLSEETINADAMINMVKEIEIKQLEGTIYLIMDNARYNRAKRLKEYTDKSGRIKLIFLPSYSPNLNIIERLWLLFQKKILHNKYYPDFSDFKNACLSFFDNLKIRYQREMKTLLTDNFQIIGA